MFSDDDRFDLKIRSVLENGREEVPDEIWDRIQARLDRPADSAVSGTKTRKVLIWLRNAGTGLAAAAAVAFAVIFSGLFDQKQQPAERYAEPIAVVGRPEAPHHGQDSINDMLIAQALPEEIPEIRDLQTDRNARIDSRETEQPSPEEIMSAAETELPVNTEGQKETPESDSPAGGTESAVEENIGEEPGDGSWDITEEEDSRPRHIKTAITLSGNAISNSNAERAGRSSMMSSGKITHTGFTDDPEGKCRYGIPVSVGAGVRLSFTPKWSLGIGLNYTFLSRTFDGIFNNAEDQTRTPYNDISNTQHYIGIPVNVYYSIVRKDFIDFYAYAGGTAEYCLSNRYAADGSADRFHHTGKADFMQFSADLGIGVEFLLTDYLGLYIDPSLRYYFKNSNAPKSIRTVQPLMLGFEAGFRFRL